MKPIKVFIGFDQRETVAYHVLCSSIMSRSSVPVTFCPIIRPHMTKRPRDANASTDFADTRFLVPNQSGYEGWSVFMDCDQLMLTDIAELWDLRDDQYAVMVRKHDHVPREDTKFLGTKQFAYLRKNWSSLMLFNNRRCTKLSREYVWNASPVDLHRFLWLENPQVGDLPVGWNHLVGYDAPNPTAKHVHYTLGGPYFSEYAGCEYSAEWRKERDAMNYCMQRGGF